MEVVIIMVIIMVTVALHNPRGNIIFVFLSIELLLTDQHFLRTSLLNKLLSLQSLWSTKVTEFNGSKEKGRLFCNQIRISLFSLL